MTTPQCPHCGKPGAVRLRIHYCFPRPAPMPEAADPGRVHGSASLTTCGSPGCEADAVLAAAHSIAAGITRDAGKEAAAGLEWEAVGPEDVTVTEQGSGVWMCWPGPPQEAW